MAKYATPSSTINPHELVDLFIPIAKDVIRRQKDLAHLNLLAGIEWSQREQIRTIQGHYKKIEDACSDLIWAGGDDYSVDASAKIWGLIEEV